MQRAGRLIDAGWCEKESFLTKENSGITRFAADKLAALATNTKDTGAGVVLTGSNSIFFPRKSTAPT